MSEGGRRVEVPRCSRYLSAQQHLKVLLCVSIRTFVRVKHFCTSKANFGERDSRVYDFKGHDGFGHELIWGVYYNG